MEEHNTRVVEIFSYDGYNYLNMFNRMGVKKMAKVKFFKDFKEGQKLFGENISAIINFIILSLVYFVGIGLTSIIGKIFGKSFLNLKEKETYWEDLNLKKDMEGYYKQF